MTQIEVKLRESRELDNGMQKQVLEIAEEDTDLYHAIKKAAKQGKKILLCVAEDMPSVKLASPTDVLIQKIIPIIVSHLETVEEIGYQRGKAECPNPLPPAPDIDIPRVGRAPEWPIQWENK